MVRCASSRRGSWCCPRKSCWPSLPNNRSCTAGGCRCSMAATRLTTLPRPMDQYTGTKPVAEGHAFDLGALERHLSANLEGFKGPLSVEQFKGGQSNPTYKLVTPGASYVMR